MLVEEAAAIKQEFYFSITTDRDRQANVVIFSTEGGVDIEEVAEKTPEKVIKYWIDAGIGAARLHIRDIAFQAGVAPEVLEQLAPVLHTMYDILRSKDAMLVEINPLALLEDGRIVALDGKMQIDDNGLFRQQDIAEDKREEGEHPLEKEAARRGLAYVKLDGHVGVIGNGAGLVMTTLDMIQRSGGQAANFLDIGGGARAEVVRNALELVLSDPDVKSVLINVFGGITRCDEVARGLLDAISTLEIKVPIVVRLAGTNAEEGLAAAQGIAADARGHVCKKRPAKRWKPPAPDEEEDASNNEHSRRQEHATDRAGHHGPGRPFHTRPDAGLRHQRGGAA